MESNYTKNVAEIILTQLKLNTPELWAWGSRNFFHFENVIEGNKYPALKFSIKTPKIQRGGRVIISLNEGTDTYIVEAKIIRGKKERLVGIKEDIYFDELHDTINSLIEDEETYYQIIV